MHGKKIIDLSISIENDIASDPPMARPKISYFDHYQTIERIQGFFPTLRPDQLPDGASWAFEKVELTTHNGTHLDAPYHYHPTMNHAVTPGGEPAATIDENSVGLVFSAWYQARLPAFRRRIRRYGGGC